MVMVVKRGAAEDRKMARAVSSWEKPEGYGTHGAIDGWEGRFEALRDLRRCRPAEFCCAVGGEEVKEVRR